MIDAGQRSRISRTNFAPLILAINHADNAASGHGDVPMTISAAGNRKLLISVPRKNET